MNISSGEIASIVVGVMLVLNYFGVTGIDSGAVTGVINGIIAIVGFGAALWSWYQHRATRVATS